MGTTYEVWAWVEDKSGGYIYAESYRGESLVAALFDAWKLKRQGIRCVKIEWI